MKNTDGNEDNLTMLPLQAKGEKYVSNHTLHVDQNRAGERPFCAIGEIVHPASPYHSNMTPWKIFFNFQHDIFPKKIISFFP